MFIAHPIPESAVFKPHSFREILSVQWHDLNALKSEKYRCVHPFLSQLDSWMEQRRSSSTSLISNPMGPTASSRALKSRKIRSPIEAKPAPSASFIGDLFDASIFSSGKRWSAEVHLIA